MTSTRNAKLILAEVCAEFCGCDALVREFDAFCVKFTHPHFRESLDFQRWPSDKRARALAPALTKVAQVSNPLYRMASSLLTARAASKSLFHLQVRQLKIGRSGS